MSKGVVIIGAGQTAQMVCATEHQFYGHSEYTGQGFFPVAFAVDREFMPPVDISDPLPVLMDRPIVPIDRLLQLYPPADYDAFVAITYTMKDGVPSGHRRAMMERIEGMGYRLASYISPMCTIYRGFKHGKNCLVLEDNTIQHDVEIGDGTFCWAGNHLGHNSKIGAYCYLASHVVVSGAVEIGEHTFIGVNATIRDNIKIGARNVIGMSASIQHDTEDDDVYPGTRTERAKIKTSQLRRI